MSGLPLMQSPTKVTADSTTLKNYAWDTTMSACPEQLHVSNSWMIDSSQHSAGCNAGPKLDNSLIQIQQTPGQFDVPAAGLYNTCITSINVKDEVTPMCGSGESVRTTQYGLFPNQLFNMLPRADRPLEQNVGLGRDFSGKNSVIQHSVSTSGIPVVPQVVGTQPRLEYKQIYVMNTRMEKKRANSPPVIDRKKVDAPVVPGEHGGIVRLQCLKTESLESDGEHVGEGGEPTNMGQIEKLLLENLENHKKHAAELKHKEELTGLIEQKVPQQLIEVKEELEHERFKLRDELDVIEKERKTWEECRKDWERQRKYLEDKTDDLENRNRRQNIVDKEVEDQQVETLMMTKNVSHLLDEKLKPKPMQQLGQQHNFLEERDTLQRGFSERNLLMQHSLSTSDIQVASQLERMEDWKGLIKQEVAKKFIELKEEIEFQKFMFRYELEKVKAEQKKLEEWGKVWERQGKDLGDKIVDLENKSRRQGMVNIRVTDKQEETWMMTKKLTDVFEEKLKRNAQKLLAKRKVNSYEQAEIAAMLLQLKFDESDAMEAACECSTVELAIRYLQQKCEVCFELYPISKMVVMLNCDHRCCRICAEEYFKTQIRNCNVVDIQCPVCNPLNSIDDEEVLNKYFARLDILLRNVVSAEVHELFQQKLRDWTFEKLGNVKWCAQCKNGYGINVRNEKALTCPHCNFVICAMCECKWEKQHDGISCEQYAKWKQENDPDFQAEGLEKHLAKHGIKCPKCNFQYSLAKGGCMHFNCLQCKFGFCSGCGQPFRIGGKCNVSIYCENYGLHAHHPRNCLFYLRDKDPDALRKLLDDSCVPYDTETAQNDKCLVNIQVETVNGFADGHCGKKVGEMYAGLCRLHYVEYLVDMINRNSIDPIATFDKDELAMEFRRHEMEVPGMASQETDVAYCARLRQVIMEEIPLEDVCSPTQA